MPEIDSQQNNMFSRFTQTAMKAAAEASVIAEKRHHAITPDHLLLGILNFTNAVAVSCLVFLEVEIEKLQSEIENHLATLPPIQEGKDSLYSAEVKKVLELTVQEADESASQWIDTKHMLIGILKSDNSFSANYLLGQKIDNEKVRKHITSIQEQQDTQPAQSAGLNRDYEAGKKEGKNWERFTIGARTALAKAQQFSEDYNEAYITPDHLLLGLLNVKEGNARECLLALKVNLDDLQDKVKQHLSLSASDSRVYKIMLSQEIKTVLELGVEEARSRNVETIDATSLLIGIIREGKSFSAQQLILQKVSAADIRHQPIYRDENTTSGVGHQSTSKEGLAGKMIFPLLLIALVAAGYLIINNPFENSFPVFLFITIGWLISLCLHEFGHAAAAYWGGDKTMKDNGYLTLNPLKYTHLVWSLGLPLLVLIGAGFGLPGAALYVNPSFIHGRMKQSLVSIAGLIATAVVGLGFTIVFHQQTAGLWGETVFELSVALAFLVYLQITAICLSLLPIPGLDGYGIIEPLLPSNIRRQLATAKPYIFFFVIIFFYMAVPSQFLYYQVMMAIMSFLNLPQSTVQVGLELFRFWQ